MRLDDLIKNARAARATLNSIISEVKAGHYANANLTQTATLYKSYGVGAISSALAGVIELA